MAKTFEGLHGDLGAPHHLGHVVVGREGEAERERGLGDRLCQTQSGEDHQDGQVGQDGQDNQDDTC